VVSPPLSQERECVTTLVAALLLLAAHPVSAHHSAAQYDFNSKIVLHGRVMQVRFANPHLLLVLAVEDANGRHAVTCEGHSMNNFYRAGWRRDMVKEGDELTVTLAPLRNGNDGGYVIHIRTADGHDF
jgi:Family of unknown function (DUF6152)